MAECPLGYHSFNCSETCKFPTFGDDCQYICDCSIDLCSHRFGCKISNGILNSSITTVINETSEKMYQTTQLSTENLLSDGNTLERPSVPYRILYMIIALVCIFLILFGLFVGIYFYKHCIQQTNITDVKDESNFNLNDGYKSLHRLETIQSVNSLRDSTYLEPLYDARLHYYEIEDQDETKKEKISQFFSRKLNKEIVLLVQRSMSCNLPIHVPDTIGLNKKTILCTNSL